MKISAITFGLCLFVAACGILCSTYAALPTYTCKLTKEAIQIDGALSEKTWNQADTLTFVQNSSGAAIAAPVEGTRVQAAWDSTYLYVAFVTQDKDVKGVYKNHDDPLWNVESVEMFFDVDSDQSTYLEFEWNCYNTTWDGMLKYANGAVTSDDASWNPAGVVSAVKVRGTPDKSTDVDTGMTVEAKIPWKSLDTNMTKKMSLPPKNNDSMRINFYRIDVLTVGGTTAQDLTAWSPTLNGTFHTPSKFGTIVFSTQTPTTVSDAGRGKLTLAPYSLSVRNNGTRISYTLAEVADVRLCIYSTDGRKLATVDNGLRGSGFHECAWNGLKDGGGIARSGAYWVTPAGRTIHDCPTYQFRPVGSPSATDPLSGVAALFARAQAYSKTAFTTWWPPHTLSVRMSPFSPTHSNALTRGIIRGGFPARDDQAWASDSDSLRVTGRRATCFSKGAAQCRGSDITEYSRQREGLWG